MDPLEEKIWSYGDLSKDERIAVDAAVELQPQFKALLEQMKALHALIDTSGFIQEPISDELLAYCVVLNRYSAGAAPPPIVQRLADRVAYAISSDRLLRERYREMEQRMRLLENAHDPSRLPDSLTGGSPGSHA